MKFILRILLISIFCFFIPLYAPWWSLFIVTFIVGFVIPGNGFNLFNAGFLGCGLVWLGMAFKINSETSGIMSEKIVALMPFSDSTLLIIIAGVIGALCGGFGTISGNSFRKIFIKPKPKSFYS